MQFWTLARGVGLLGVCAAPFAFAAHHNGVAGVRAPGEQGGGGQPLSAPAPTIKGRKGALASASSIAPARLITGNYQTYRLEVQSVSDADLKPLLQVEASGANRAASGNAGTDAPAGKPAPVFGQTAYHFQSTLRARLSVGVVSRQQNSVEAVYMLQDPALQLTINGSPADALAHSLEQELTHAVAARMTPQGRILSARFAPNTSEGAQRLMRSLLALTQWVTPAAWPRPAAGRTWHAPMRNWRTQEEDAFGVYEASYHTASPMSVARRRRGGASLPLTVRKIITRYLPPASAADAGDQNQVEMQQSTQPSGSASASVDDRTGRPRRIRGDLQQTNRVMNKVVGHTRTLFSLELTHQEPLSDRGWAGLRRSDARLQNMPAVRLSARPSRQASELDVQRTELGQATLPGLLAQLGQAEAITAPDYDDTPLYLKFKALLILHPESCAALGDLLQSAPPRSRAMQILVRALATVGSPQAQNALIAAAGARKQDLNALTALLPALGMVAAPTPDAEAALRRFALQPQSPDAAHTALLLLGAMAHNLAAAQPARAARLVAWIERQESAPVGSGPEGAEQARERTKRVLSSLGNAGSPRILPYIRRALKQAAPDVRAEAASALRFIGQNEDKTLSSAQTRRASEQADALLAATLSDDKEAGVRMQALFALSFRRMTPRTFAAQKRVLLEDASDAARQATLANLWNARAAFPAALSLVQQARTRDASKNVRQAASSLLGTPPDSAGR